MEATSQRLIVIGKISKAHGLRGEIVVRPDVEGSTTLLRQKSVLLRGPGTEPFSVELEAARQANDVLLVKLRGFDDRTSAEKLAGSDLLLPRQSLPALDAGEFYACDLVGLSVKAQSGELLGRVVELFDAGAGPVLEIDKVAQAEQLVALSGSPEGLSMPEARARRDVGVQFQVPLVEQFVKRIDLEAGEIIIEPPEEEEEG